uniref:Aminotransferase-like plant mobile domain-containing protein n=1 Tax=Oryza glumipatula TaxID=40148 RepID=A0A0E0AUU3_9ORYZ
MAKFDDWKRKQVIDAGFGGLLDLQQINLINRRYTTWLLGWVCPERRTLAVGKILEVKLTPKNVNKVLGIPCEGLAVCPMEDESKEERDSFVQLVIGAPGFEENPVVGAEQVVSQTYTEDMKRNQGDMFTTAFAVWIVGTFLAPTTSHKSKVNNSPGSIDFWGALQKVDAIKDYNWAEYVLEHLLEAAKKAQEDLRCKNSYTVWSAWLGSVSTVSVGLKGTGNR